MHAGSKFTIREVLFWTRRETFIFILIATAPTVVYALTDWEWMTIPWLPIALVGTAVAFLVGFKNNATYDRLWEARKIWGAIVNSSRSWGIMARDFVTNRHAADPLPASELKVIHQRLIYRHIGWLTALRYQLRQPKAWESSEKAHSKEFRRRFEVPELTGNLEEELANYLDREELAYVLSKKNRATQIISLQSSDLRQLEHDGFIEDFRHMQLENMLVDFYTQQGKCERIKNFPYPRQFATVNLYFVWIFILLMPLGMVREFADMGPYMVWLNIPFCTLVAWIFHTMEKIGGATENPFEGGANDIPMAALSRTIEIDLREMLDETHLPKPLAPVNNILM